jgi:predicted NUDIX family NTP pyrophosphohydrolase
MKQSAGLLVFRRKNHLEVLLVHPGGPFYAKKDEGVWSIPKGEYLDEDPLEAAKKEFTEETGNIIQKGPFIKLEDIKLKSGKRVSAWAVEHDFENSFISSNTFELEWPPRSGKLKVFPEVDKAEWFSVEDASRRLNPAQKDFLTQLEFILASES